MIFVESLNPSKWYKDTIQQDKKFKSNSYKKEWRQYYKQKISVPI